MRRATRLTLLLVVFALIAAGCAKNESDSEEVRDLVDLTAPNPFRFIYEVEQAGVKYRVQGLIEDDLRYKLQLAIDGRPALEQVVVDDAVAVRFLAPGLVETFVDERVADLVDLDTDVEGATVLEALKAQRWVLDPVGAPSLLLTARDVAGADDAEVSDDPLYDARTALAYVRLVSQRQNFVRYDAESLEPTYRADEDPFAAPADGSGTTRFDTAIFDLPSPDDAGGGTGAAFPGYLNMRKMAVYVKDERVIAVREVIELTPRQTQDLIEYADTLVRDTAPDDVYQDFRRTIDQLPPDKVADFILQGINSFRDSSGQAPVRFRRMSLELQDIGDPGIEVVLPTDEVITGSLAILDNMGRKPFVDDASTDGLGDSEGPGFDGAATSAPAEGTPSTVAPETEASS